jgi:hypothetical protein
MDRLEAMLVFVKGADTGVFPPRLARLPWTVRLGFFGHANRRDRGTARKKRSNTHPTCRITRNSSFAGDTTAITPIQQPVMLRPAGFSRVQRTAAAATLRGP